MTQQLHVAGLQQAIEDGYFDTTNANKSSVRVHGGQSSEFPIYPTTLERTIIPWQLEAIQMLRNAMGHGWGVIFPGGKRYGGILVWPTS